MRSPLASPFRGGWRNLTPMRGRGRGGANPWTPAMLPPYAWYDAELGQPKNVGYVELDGASGDNIQTPDSAALSFSNDIEVVMRVRVTDWSTGSGQTLCGKYVSTGNQRSWRFYVSSTGSIGLSVSQDGTSSVTTVTVTPTVALADDAWVWLRMRLDLSNGTNSVGTLETAADTGDNVEPASWTANGTNTGTTIATVFDSTAAVEIGAFAAGTLERLAGSVGRCIVRNGFGGTTVADFNASDCYGDGYTHTDGYRWTLGLPKIYDRSGNNHPPAVFGSGSNQPLWLPWDGTPSVYLPGTAGNAISAPHAASHDITGDIEIVANVVMGSVTVAQRIVSRGTTSWGVFISASNTLGLAFRFGGSMAYGAAALGANINVPLWVKITRSAASGLVSFYSAPDSQNEPTSWSLLGTSTPTAPGAMDPITTSIFLGGYATTGENFTGGIRKVVVRDGIGGSRVVDFDASLCGQSGYTDSVGNVWTVNRGTAGRKSVVQSPAARSARSVILHGTDDRFTVPAVALPTLGTSGVGSVAAVQRKWATLGTNDRVFDSKASDSATAAGFYVKSDAATASVLAANAGDGTTQANSTVVSGVVSGVRQIVGLTVSATQVQAFSNNTFATAVSRPVGSMDSGGDLIVMANSTGVEYSDGTVEAVIIQDAEMSAVDQALLVAYYGGGL